MLSMRRRSRAPQSLGGKRTADSSGRALACCQGFLILAEDGPLGEVETPLFPAGSDEPAYLVMRTEDPVGHVLRPVIPASLVEKIDLDRGLLDVRGTVREVEHLLHLADASGAT